MIENTVPILNVVDLDASLTFYADVFGFREEWSADVDGDTVVGLVRDGCQLMLGQGRQGSRGSWFWMGVDEERFLDRVAASGVEIVQAATDYPWAYELRVADPDGNVIRIGTGPREGQKG